MLKRAIQEFLLPRNKVTTRMCDFLLSLGVIKVKFGIRLKEYSLLYVRS